MIRSSKLALSYFHRQGESYSPERVGAMDVIPSPRLSTAQYFIGPIGLPSSWVVLANSVANERTCGGTQSGSDRVATPQFIAENAAYNATGQALVGAWIV